MKGMHVKIYGVKRKDNGKSVAILAFNESLTNARKMQKEMSEEITFSSKSSVSN
jgi:hypothetical protein